jgi:hypothetical protein
MSDVPPIPEVAEMPKRGLKFLAAWAIAQKEMGSAKKDKTNPHFGSSYATMESVVEAISGPFEKAGLVWIQEPFANLKSVGVVTYILHAASGEGTYSKIEYPMPGNGNPQVYGSLQTYAKRYCLQTAAGLPTATKDEDDGNAASQPGSPIRPPKTAPPPSQAQPLSPGRQLTGFKVPSSFKNNGGKDLAELEAKELSSLADYFLKQSQNPAKAAYAAQNKALHDACVLEAMKRQGA